jgi:hypothetical protein
MIEAGKCQTQCVPHISEGKAGGGDISIGARVRLMLKRYLPARNKRKLKRYFNSFMQFIKKSKGKTASSENGKAKAGAAGTSPIAIQFKPGDMVRVKSLEEVRATLDEWKELRGCLFMDAMQEYCGTQQRVLQPVERFVDERDYRVKKAKGIILLEGLLCHGTPVYGRCDRACYYFWRNEWLEKIDG